MSDAGLVTLLSSVVSDKVLAKRIVELKAAQDALDAAREATQKAQRENQDILAKIQAERRNSEVEAAKVAADRAAVEKRAEGLTDVIATHNAERERWEAMRTQVEAEHAEKEARHAGTTEQLAETSCAHAEREAGLTERETAVQIREATLERKLVALRSALEVE